MPLRHKEAWQLPIEIIIAPVGNSDPTFDLLTATIFDCNGGAKINKFLDSIKSIVIGRNLRINTPQDYLSITYTLLCPHLLSDQS